MGSDPPPGVTPYTRLVLAALVLAALFAYARMWGRCVEAAGVDFYQFWVTGRAARLGPGIDPYTPEGRRAIPAAGLAGARYSPDLAAAAAYRRELETYSSPLLYALVGAASTTRYDRDRLAFEAASMAGLVGGLLLLGHALRLGWVARLGLLVFVLEWNEPVFADAGVGNVNRLQLALIALGFVLARTASPARAALVGALWTAATLLKPNLALLPLWLGVLFAVRRRWHELFLAGAGAAAAGVVCVILAAGGGFPWARWEEWLRAAAAMPEGIIPLDLGNLSLARALRLSTGIEMAVPAVLALSVLLAVVLRRRGPVPGEEHLVLALGALAYLLVARLVWIHYFVLALPAACACLRPGSRSAAAGTAVLALGCFAVRPVFTVLGRVDLTLEFVLMNAGALGLFAATLAELALPRGAGRRASIGTPIEASA